MRWKGERRSSNIEGRRGQRAALQTGDVDSGDTFDAKSL